MLFSPVRQDPETLALVRESHRTLNWIDRFVYFDDNSDPESSRLLRGGLIMRIQNEVGRPDYSGHGWTNGLTMRMTNIRNIAIQYFLSSDCTHLFMIDSDVVVNPDLVKHLVSLDLPIVSEVFWSKWNPAQTWLPQVWDIQSCGYFGVERIIRLRDPGIYDVGGLGACTLMRRDALSHPELNYSRIPSLMHVGEDRHFCVRAQVLGIPLHADTQMTPFHVYRIDQLEEAKEWYETGADPSYFREVWLTPAWEEEVKSTVEMVDGSKVML
jgi:hypothetical protein